MSSELTAQRSGVKDEDANVLGLTYSSKTPIARMILAAGVGTWKRSDGLEFPLSWTSKGRLLGVAAVPRISFFVSGECSGFKPVAVGRSDRVFGASPGDAISRRWTWDWLSGR